MWCITLELHSIDIFDSKPWHRWLSGFSIWSVGAGHRHSAQWAERGVDPILGSYGTLLDYLGPY